MTRIRYVPVLQTAKVLGILGFLLGAVSSCVGLILVMIRSTESPVVTLMGLIALPFLSGLVSFGLTAMACACYNQLSVSMGGIRLDLEGDVAGRPQAAGTEADLAAGPEEPAAAGPPAKERSQVKTFSLFRVKPNPAGKCRPGDGRPPAELVCAEWVDIRNRGRITVSTKGVSLYHLAYTNPAAPPEGRLVASLPDRWLKPGEILRMHSGQRRDLSQVRQEDRIGADWHSFIGEDVFSFNHREGDTLVLYEVATEEAIDSASYGPNPPEDVILLRQGAKLVHAHAAAAAR